MAHPADIKIKPSLEPNFSRSISYFFLSFSSFL